MVYYQIKWKTSAKKDLKKLDKTIIPKILKAVESLVENPRPSGVKKIIDSYSTYRLRVGIAKDKGQRTKDKGKAIVIYSLETYLMS